MKPKKIIKLSTGLTAYHYSKDGITKIEIG